MADFASCDVRLPPRKEGKEADQQPLIVVLGLTSAPDPGLQRRNPALPDRREERPTPLQQSELSWRGLLGI